MTGQITGNHVGTVRLSISNSNVFDLRGNRLDTSGSHYREDYSVDRRGPVVTDIVAPVLSNQQLVTTQVFFSKAVTGVDAADFAFDADGIVPAIADIAQHTTGHGFEVVVDTGVGSGSFTLRLVDDDSIIDSLGNPLGNSGIGNGSYTSSYTTFVDRTPPNVFLFERDSDSSCGPTMGCFLVTFDSSVANVAISSFTTIVEGSLVNPQIVSVEELPDSDGMAYRVTASADSGNGRIEIELVDDDQIRDAANNPLGGLGHGNGNYISSEAAIIEFAPNSSISGYRWNDANRNGIFDNSESALEHSTVFLDENNNWILDPGEESTTTDINGYYEFNGLSSGRYIVRDLLEEHWHRTSPNTQYGVNILQRPNVNASMEDWFASTPSRDGRYVTFVSQHDPVTGEATVHQIYVYDRLSGEIDRASIGLNGTTPNGDSRSPKISDDGRYVAFHSSASNLVENDTNPGYSGDIFVFDRVNRETVLVSVGLFGESANASVGSDFEFTGNGRGVAFSASASNLVAEDTNQKKDIFYRDLDTQHTERISISSNGVQANEDSYDPSMSDTGDLIAFRSTATHLVDEISDGNTTSRVFLHDRRSGDTSTIPKITDANSISHASDLQISGDGNTLLFRGSRPGIISDRIWIWNRLTDTVERVRFELDDESIFISNSRFKMSDDGQLLMTSGVHPDRTSGVGGVFFVLNRQTDTTYAVSSSEFGHASPMDELFNFHLSGDGSTIVFSSFSNLLTVSDRNEAHDVFTTSALDMERGANTVSLLWDDAQTEQNFGAFFETPTNSVSGVLWKDQNRNGIQDEGEEPLANFPIYADLNLSQSHDGDEPAAFSDANGFYELTDLPEGTVHVRPVLGNVWEEFMTGAERVVTLGGRVKDIFDFDELTHNGVNSVRYPAYERWDFVFSSSSRTSLDWQVLGNSNPFYRPTSAQLAPVTQSGTYGTRAQLRRLSEQPFSVRSIDLRTVGSRSGGVVLEGLKSNGEIVREFHRIGSKLSTYELEGFDDLIEFFLISHSGYNVSRESFAVDNLELSFPFHSALYQDFALMQKPGRIVGQVYLDENENQLWDQEEATVAGRLVVLDLNQNGRLDLTDPTTLTTSLGTYGFHDLDPGFYQVMMESFGGWTTTDFPDGRMVEVEPTIVASGINFGVKSVPSRISGYHYEDLNTDGRRQAHEPGLGGWTIFLDLNGDAVWNANEPSTESRFDDPNTIGTDETGYYELNGALDGTYEIRVVPRENWYPTNPFATDHSSTIVARGTGSELRLPPEQHEQAVSADGRYVAFVSKEQLSSVDKNTSADVYLLDRLTGVLRPVSVGAGTQTFNGRADSPDISGDGRFVVFSSVARLVSEDSGSERDIYLWDRDQNSVQLISKSESGEIGNSHSERPKISGDGASIVFESTATNLTDIPNPGYDNVYLKNVASGELLRVNQNEDPANSSVAEISKDGRYVVFASFSSQIVDGDSNGATDVFRFDTATGDTIRVSSKSNGVEANGWSYRSSISDDGRYVAFESVATNLTSDRVFHGSRVLLKDLETGSVNLVSRDESGLTRLAQNPVISGDGTKVVYETVLVYGPGNRPTYQDVFLYHRNSGDLQLFRHAADGSARRGNRHSPSLSRDGQNVLYISNAENTSQSSQSLVAVDFSQDVSRVLPRVVSIKRGDILNEIHLASRFGPLNSFDAIDDSYLTSPSTSTIFPVLNNDRIFTGVEVLSVSQPKNGSVSIEEDGNVIYLPKAGFTGDDSFEYTIGIPSVELQSSQTSVGSRFGNSVAISGDIAVVGSYRLTQSGVRSAGSAFVFERGQHDLWQQVAVLHGDLNSDDTSSAFGWSVAIDGNTVVVGAIRDRDRGYEAGAAYVFAKDSGGPGAWGRVAKIYGSDTNGGDNFGRSVAIDGDTIVVGASIAAAVGSASGAAYVFQRNQGGDENWGQVKRLLGSTQSAGDRFGQSISISGDTIAVGAFKNDDLALDAGAVFLFDRNEGGSGNWGQTSVVYSDSATPADFFGYSISLAGSVLAVGAPQADEAEKNQSGAVFVFDREQSGDRLWQQTERLLATNSAAGDRLGWSVANDGTRIVSGAIQADIGGDNSGIAYVFERDEDDWKRPYALVNEHVSYADEFGVSVSISGDFALVGSWLDSNANTGSAYIFDVLHDTATVYVSVATNSSSRNLSVNPSNLQHVPVVPQQNTIATASDFKWLSEKRWFLKSNESNGARDVQFDFTAKQPPHAHLLVNAQEQRLDDRRVALDATEIAFASLQDELADLVTDCFEPI